MTLFGPVAQQVAQAAGMLPTPGGRVPHIPTFRCLVCDIGWPDARACPVDPDHPGIAHDSASEDRWYQGLVVRERAGEIAELRPHPAFPLLVNGVAVGTYTADAAYLEAGQRIVADYKSRYTARSRAWRRTARLFRACYPDTRLVEVVE